MMRRDAYLIGLPGPRRRLARIRTLLGGIELRLLGLSPWQKVRVLRGLFGVIL